MADIEDGLEKVYTLDLFGNEQVGGLSVDGECLIPLHCRKALRFYGLRVLYCGGWCFFVGVCRLSLF